MREIKFRGKTKFDSKWIYGTGFYYDGVMAFKTSTDIDYIKEELNYTHTPLIPETIGQYTGLKDKNCVEIYEGDIVKYFDGMFRLTYVITYYQQAFRYQRYLVKTKEYLDYIGCIGESLNKCEVIGNIYDKEVSEDE